MSERKTGKRKNPFHSIHFTSTFSMSLVLFLIGLVSLLFFVARDISRYVKENINLSVVLDDQIDDAYVHRIEKYLTAAPFTKSVQYISKSDALKDHIASLGENPEEFLGYNPLLASLEVKLNAAYANPDSVSRIEKKLKAFDHINQVAYQKDMVSLVNDNVKKVGLILLGLSLILLVISVALINNTIRLTIYSNRFLINTMKLVGATSWFIRRPYIVKSMLNGLLASVLSIIFLAGTVFYIQQEYGLPGMLIRPVSAVIVGLIVIFVGVLLTALSSFFAVGRFLRMHSDDMYSL
jgi:cell division transport system permease protein